MHVLAHADVVHEIPARVIRIQVDDELVARLAPRRGYRPIPVRNLEHTAWQPNAAGCKVKASDCVEVRRADEREVPRLEWVLEVESRIVGRGVPIPVVVTDVLHRGRRSPGFDEWRRVAGLASDHDAGRQVHGIMQAFDGRDRAAHQDERIAHRLHPQHADTLLDQRRHASEPAYVRADVALPSAQSRLGTTRPDILLTGTGLETTEARLHDSRSP